MCVQAILRRTICSTFKMSRFIFVYGTLKSGQPNHYLIADETRGTCAFRGKALTVEKYPLVVASRFNIPYLLYEPGRGQHVEGELYEVDDTRLAILDDLENHPKLYERTSVKLKPVNDDKTTESGVTFANMAAEAYFLVKYRPALLDLPFINNFADNVDGKKYVLPKDRKAATPGFWYEVHSGYEKTDSSLQA